MADTQSLTRDPGPSHDPEGTDAPHGRPRHRDGGHAGHHGHAHPARPGSGDEHAEAGREGPDHAHARSGHDHADAHHHAHAHAHDHGSAGHAHHHGPADHNHAHDHGVAGHDHTHDHGPAGHAHDRAGHRHGPADRADGRPAGARHAQAVPPAFSLLRLSFAERLGAALVATAAIWLGVAWAML